MRYLILLVALGAGAWLWLAPPGFADSTPSKFLQSSAPQDPLNTADIIRYTNEYRRAHDLPPLTNNDQLSAAARARALDMQEHGYFDHQNPVTGDGPGEAIETAGYVARTYSENIARGRWRSSQQLVQGWIDSPGHRENILREDVREIGVAIVRSAGATSRGPFAFHYAVQLFGRPLADCGELPGADDRTAIEAKRDALERQRARITDLVRDLEALHARISAATDRREHSRLTLAYNARVDQYNLLVSEAQQTQQALERRIDGYNLRVKAFNSCGME